MDLVGTMTNYGGVGDDKVLLWISFGSNWMIILFKCLEYIYIYIFGLYFGFLIQLNIILIRVNFGPALVHKACDMNLYIYLFEVLELTV